MFSPLDDHWRVASIYFKSDCLPIETVVKYSDVTLSENIGKYEAGTIISHVEIVLGDIDINNGRIACVRFIDDSGRIFAEIPGDQFNKF